MQEITLYCREGTADKQYSVRIAPAENGLFIVEAFNGRRGGTLTRQLKTKAPVTREEAERVFSGVVKEKAAKGYRAGDAAPAMAASQSDSEGDRPDVPKPMLLNPITIEEARALLTDDAWMLQVKWDGVRCHLYKVDGAVRGVSRTDKPIAIPERVRQAALAITERNYVLDGELIGDELVAFDILWIDGQSMTDLPADLRYLRVNQLVHNAMAAGRLGSGASAIYCTPAAMTTYEKVQFFAVLIKNGHEGAVFKRKSAPYTAGRPNTGGDALKHKFTASASVIVFGPNGEKRSVIVGLADGRVLGKVTIPPNREIPATGSVCEVSYLYVHDVGGQLIQPVYKGVREDVDASACTADQLQIKGAKR